MQIRLQLTPAEIQEAIRLSRTKNFWFKFALGNWYLALICLFVVGADIDAAFHGRTPRWDATGVLFAIAAVVMCASWFLWKGRMSAAIRNANSRVQMLSLDPDGVRSNLNSGSSTFVPWSNYTKWVEGATVSVLISRDGIVIIPVDGSNRDTVRSLLSGHVR